MTRRRRLCGRGERRDFTADLGNVSIAIGTLLLILVKALTTLPAVHSREYHAAQEWRWCIEWVFVLLINGFSRPQCRVKSNVIEQGKWAHRIAASKLHGSIDVVARSHAVLQHTYCCQHIRDEQEVNNKACCVFCQDGRFPQRNSKLLDGFNRLF